jgi:hypothetical protein
MKTAKLTGAIFNFFFRMRLKIKKKLKAFQIRYSSLSTAYSDELSLQERCVLDGGQGFDSLQWHYFSLRHRVHTGWMTWVLISGVKWPEREADHLALFSSDMKNACSYNSAAQVFK